MILPAHMRVRSIPPGMQANNNSSNLRKIVKIERTESRN